MKFTKEQLAWVRAEQETLARIMESKPEIGLFRYAARQEALQLLIDVHNVAVEATRKDEKK